MTEEKDSEPTVALLLMTDGRRQYIHKTIASAQSELHGPITEKWMHDDSGDENQRQWLREQFPDFVQIGEGPRRGFGGAYDFAWKTLVKKSKTQYVFALEDDFTFNRPVLLGDMIKVLDENPSVYQMALKRQAWSSEEIRVGGFMERWPESFHQQDGWVSHRLFFSTNPSLYRRSLIENWDFPSVKDAEGHFSWSIRQKDPESRFGYWGNVSDSPWVTHIGEQRGRGSY